MNCDQEQTDTKPELVTCTSLQPCRVFTLTLHHFKLKTVSRVSETGYVASYLILRAEPVQTCPPTHTDSELPEQEPSAVLQLGSAI